MIGSFQEFTWSFQIPKYEHIDILWGKDVHKSVIREVLAALENFSEMPTGNLYSDNESNGLQVYPSEVRIELFSFRVVSDLNLWFRRRQFMLELEILQLRRKRRFLNLKQ